MVLLEQFKDKVRPDIRSHLDEQKVEELEKAAVMADDYALTHKMSSKSGNPQQKRYHGSGIYLFIYLFISILWVARSFTQDCSTTGPRIQTRINKC